MWVEGGVGGVCVWRGEWEVWVCGGVRGKGGGGGLQIQSVCMSGACKMVFTAADFAAPNMTLVPHRGMYEHSCPRMREIM